eukprot:COSAG06_NODE_1287_length_9996_cov_24.173083_9_plen_91_part_00
MLCVGLIQNLQIHAAFWAVEVVRNRGHEESNHEKQQPLREDAAAGQLLVGQAVALAIGWSPDDAEPLLILLTFFTCRLDCSRVGGRRPAA